jgi:hypothetical protein
MRAETIEALSPAQLRVWRAQLTPEAQALAGNLPIEEPLDLMDRYAMPLCLSLAAIVAVISRYDAEGLCKMAQQVSATSAEPYEPRSPRQREVCERCTSESLSCWPRGAPGIWVRGALANYAPNQLDFTRLDGGHLTLGAWPHSCVAAGLIHMAAVSITAPLLQRFASAKPARPIEWQGGSGFRSPRSLWVCLTARDD